MMGWLIRASRARGACGRRRGSAIQQTLETGWSGLGQNGVVVCRVHRAGQASTPTADTWQRGDGRGGEGEGVRKRCRGRSISGQRRGAAVPPWCRHAAGSRLGQPATTYKASRRVAGAMSRQMGDPPGSADQQGAAPQGCPSRTVRGAPRASLQQQLEEEEEEQRQDDARTHAHTRIRPLAESLRPRPPPRTIACRSEARKRNEREPTERRRRATERLTRRPAWTGARCLAPANGQWTVPMPCHAMALMGDKFPGGAVLVTNMSPATCSQGQGREREKTTDGERMKLG